MTFSSNLDNQQVLHLAERLFSHLLPPEKVEQLGMRGAAGTITFLSTLARHSSNPDIKRIAEGYVGRLMELLDGTVPATLYAGLSGAALAVYCFDTSWGVPIDDERYSDVLATLSQVLLGNNADALNFDHITGVVGIGAFCHVAKNIPGSEATLHQAFNALAERATWSTEGCYWETTEAWFPVERRNSERPIRNLGLAHGVPGVIALLAAACRDGRLPEEYQPLLRRSCDWLVSRLIEKDGRLSVGFFDDDGAEARVAWCYGAPGVGYCLALAGAALGDQRLLQTANRLLVDAFAHKSDEALWLSEPTLCHGYSGVAHLLSRTTRILHDGGIVSDEISSIARRLYTQALQGLNETIAAGHIPEKPFNRANWFDFLEGLTGASLALLEADATSPAPWEALLLTQ